MRFVLIQEIHITVHVNQNLQEMGNRVKKVSLELKVLSSLSKIFEKLILYQIHKINVFHTPLWLLKRLKYLKLSYIFS